MDESNRISQDPPTGGGENAAPPDVDNVQRQIMRLRDEIDALQVGLAEKSRPWYKQVSIIIALAAFVLSAITTGYSEIRTYNQEVNSDRQELSELIRRMSAIPKERIELLQKYSKDQATGNQATAAALSEKLGEENTVLAKRAAEIIIRLPLNRISASECVAVSKALGASNAFDRSIEVIQRGLSVVKDGNELADLLDLYGGILYEMGDHAGGAIKFQQVLDTFKRFPSKVDWHIEATQATTELAWAEAVIIYTTQCQESAIHMERAADHVSRAGSGRVELVPRLRLLRSAVDECRSAA